MIRIFAQVSMPGAGTQPAKGSLFDSIFGPIMPLITDAWWVVLHLLMPACLLMGVAGIIIGGLIGSKRSMARGQGAVLAVPIALVLLSIAVLVSNWVITSY